MPCRRHVSSPDSLLDYEDCRGRGRSSKRSYSPNPAPIRYAAPRQKSPDRRRYYPSAVRRNAPVRLCSPEDRSDSSHSRSDPRPYYRDPPPRRDSPDYDRRSSSPESARKPHYKRRRSPPLMRQTRPHTHRPRYSPIRLRSPSPKRRRNCSPSLDRRRYYSPSPERRRHSSPPGRRQYSPAPERRAYPERRRYPPSPVRRRCSANTPDRHRPSRSPERRRFSSSYERRQSRESSADSLFVLDLSSSNIAHNHSCIYDRSGGGTILGADDSISSYLLRKCFNCGSMGHSLNNCIHPTNTRQIQKARREYGGAKNTSSPQQHVTEQRLHESAIYEDEKAEWIEKFKPGQVSEALREALGFDDDEVLPEYPWYESMAMWGYPVGWTDTYWPDPYLEMRHQVYCQIWDETEGVSIFEGNPDDIISPIPKENAITTQQDKDKDPLSEDIQIVDDDVDDDDDVMIIEDDSDPLPRQTEEVLRFVLYPTDRFISSKLPLYRGTPL